MSVINSIEELNTLYGLPSFRAKHKQQSQLDKHCINFINTSPFVVISTTNASYKMDASPRGGQPGFIAVVDENTLVIPDAKGNNRIDSLKNIIETKTIGMLFLIPGIDETLRVNGSASITTKDTYLNIFVEEKKPPKVCILVKVEEAFLHCAKAFMRSKLWNEISQIDRNSFPTMGEMLKDQIGGNQPIETHEAMVNRYSKDL